MDNPTILLGLTRYNNKPKGVILHWKDNNGLLIAGQSGSGKSQTASFLLNQYAAFGVKLALCDYDSPDGNDETLSSRVSHLSDAFFLPPVKTSEDIQRTLTAIDAEYRLRLSNPDRNFPLLLVIDEVSAFLSYLSDNKKRGEDPIKTFAQNLLQVRKVNIRTMIIGQEWSSGFATTAMRQIRSAFGKKLVHRLDRANVNLVMGSVEADTQRKISNLKTGQAFYSDRYIAVPMLTDEMKQWAIARMKQYPTYAPITPEPIQTKLYRNETYLHDLGTFNAT
ncbi:ATP-binding protein [Chloroflexales bacterium ZM16-3]|nr:ATP-binding protein [Chloroflexales bacterium ZM16-3]